jgi:hypothetical protein
MSAPEILEALLSTYAVPENAAALERWPAEQVVSVARGHRLAPLLGASLTGSLSPALGKAFAKEHMLTVARSMMLERYLSEVLDRFGEAGIRAIVLKGLAYDRTLYGAIGSRQTLDIDLLVAPSDRRAALHSLYRLGYRAKNSAPGFDSSDYHEITLVRDVEVDLHTAFAPRSRGSIDYQSVWRRVLPLEIAGRQALQLSAVDACLFHCLNMTMHHFEVPAVYLVDLRALVKSQRDLAALEEEARRFRCLRALTTSLSLCGRWFPDVGSALAGAIHHPRARRVLGRFAAPANPRWVQLRTKYEHFDSFADALRYTAGYVGRLLREARLRHTPIEERLMPGDEVG